MRIAQVAPLAESVPPKLYGGTERVVSWLTEELVALGHEVTLFASADSVTRAKLAGVIPRALRLARPRPDPGAAYAVLLDAVADAASEFDVIHCHVDWVHLPLLARLDRPFLTTLHGRLDLPGLRDVVRRFPEAAFVSISDSQRLALPTAHWLGTVHHGLPVGQLQPSFAAQGYLAFLGRITRDKGPRIAVRLARAAGLPLRMAAKIPRADNRYYKERLEPLIDGDQIRLLGEVDDRGKGELLRSAAALLFPIDWPEPFGLVMIEAMACGTPVIAFRRGSVPEVIDDGVSGFIVDSEEEALAAIRRIGTLDRRSVRAAFEGRFTARRMAEDYLRHYQALAAGPRPRGGQTELKAHQISSRSPPSEADLSAERAGNFVAVDPGQTFSRKLDLSQVGCRDVRDCRSTNSWCPRCSTHPRSLSLIRKTAAQSRNSSRRHVTRLRADKTG